MKKKIMLTAICLSAGTAALAGPAENFAKYDTDKDGFLSMAEYVAMRADWASKKGETDDEAQTKKFFANKDKDKDGKLTLEEFSTK